VRLIQGNSIDVGARQPRRRREDLLHGPLARRPHGLGLRPDRAERQAALLNATGGGLSNQLFINSSIGGGAQALVNGILGLDPLNVADQFGVPLNIIQRASSTRDAANQRTSTRAPPSARRAT
jgi:hypothetical protein